MSPYAQKLRDHLLSLDLPAPVRTRFEAGDLTGADRVWQALCGAPPPLSQIQRWIAGKVHCRRADCQPPGYTPPPKRNGPTQPKAWHPLAGTAPDGVVATMGETTAAAVIRYRRRAKIAAFKAATPVAPSKPTTPQG